MFPDIGNGVAVSVAAIFDWIHLAVQYLYRLVGLFRPTYMYPHTLWSNNPQLPASIS
jgi:hypothetical protein